MTTSEIKNIHQRGKAKEDQIYIDEQLKKVYVGEKVTGRLLYREDLTLLKFGLDTTSNTTVTEDQSSISNLYRHFLFMGS